VRKPQAKNRVETIAIARRSVFSGTVLVTVAGPDWLRMAMAGDPGNLPLVYLNIQSRKTSSPWAQRNEKRCTQTSSPDPRPWIGTERL
jgi:hypothetical protein